MKEDTLNKKIQRIRQDILNGNESNSEYGIIEILREDDRRSQGKYETELLDTIIGTKHEQELSYYYGVPFSEAYYYKSTNNMDYSDETHIRTSRFKKIDGTVSQIILNLISARAHRMRFLKAQAKLLPFYKKQGQIIVDGCLIPITRKELIEAGLDPKQFGWRSIETSKSIAHATMGVSKSEIESAKDAISKEKVDSLEGEKNDVHDNR